MRQNSYQTRYRFCPTDRVRISCHKASHRGPEYSLSIVPFPRFPLSSVSRPLRTRAPGRVVHGPIRAPPETVLANQRHDFADAAHGVPHVAGPGTFSTGRKTASSGVVPSNRDTSATVGPEAFP